MEASKPLEKFTAKQRLVIIFGIGIIAIIMTIFLKHSEIEDTPIVNNNISNTVKNPNKVVMSVEHRGNEVGQPIRDPFIIPSNITNRLENKMENVSSSISNHDTPKPVNIPTPIKPKDLVKLTGIVSTAHQRLAVIQSANKSKAYQLDEFIGLYQLISIQEDFVILRDNDGQLILSLEAAKHNGGNK
jgi:low affinity Fe/Cu permease